MSLQELNGQRASSLNGGNPRTRLASEEAPAAALSKLKEQAHKLSVSDRLALISALIQSLQNTVQIEDWQYLVARPHPWRRQLYIKGRKLLASTVWQDMILNKMSPNQAAENWDLPLPSIYEVIRYCESHQDLLKLEADEERYRLEAKGLSLDPTTAA